METQKIEWIIETAVSMLKPHFPNITAETLTAALENISNSQIERPLTRKEAMQLLNCTQQTLHRYINAGKLRRIRITSRCVRIDPKSVRELLYGEQK